MPPKNIQPGSAEGWLARAKSNLAKARQPKPADVFWEDQCFETHQAIEKALKGVYQKRGLLFKFVHDIEELGRGLELGGLRVPSVVRQAIKLNRYAYEGRYPGPYEPATEREFREALALAEAVVAWADKIISAPEKSGDTFLHEPPGRAYQASATPGSANPNFKRVGPPAIYRAGTKAKRKRKRK